MPLIPQLLLLIAQVVQPATPPAVPPSPAALQRAAMAQQREAARKQSESLGLHMTVGTDSAATAGPVADCEPIAEPVITPIIEAAAKTQTLDSKLIRAVVEQESALRPCAVSAKGAQGLMQLMPDTAEGLGVHDAFDPQQNVDGGSKYLKQLVEKYKGDLALALGAYNAGPTMVDQAGGVPDIPETKDYVDSILKKLGITRTAPPSNPTTTPTGN